MKRTILDGSTSPPTVTVVEVSFGDQAKLRDEVANELAAEKLAQVAGRLWTDLWVIPADGSQQATVQFGTADTVWFVVDGTPHQVEPVGGLATFEVEADGPGPIPVEVQDKRLVIVAAE